MRIPVSQGPQEALQPISGAMVQAPGVRGPSTMKAIAGALGEINQAREEADNLRVEDQINQARARQLSIRQKASEQLGANVLPKDGKSFTGSHLDEYDAEMQKMEEGLSNNNQKRLFRQRQNLIRQSLEVDLQAHESRQMKVYSDDVDLGTIRQEVDTAKTNVGNMTELALGRIRVEGAVASLAKRNGWAPEKVDEERTKALTGFHGGVVGAAIDAGNLDYAKAYLEQHGKEMDPDLRDKLEKGLKSADADSQSLEISRSALEASRAAGLDKTKGYELIDKMAGNNKDVRDKAMASFDHDFRVYKEQQKDLKDQDEAGVWSEVLAGKGPQAAYKAIGTAKNLDDTERAKLLKEVQRYYKGDAEDRADAREAERERKAAELLQYQLNPERVWQMSDAQMTKLLPGLGPEGVSKLVTMKQEMQKRGTQSAQVDADYFKKVAYDAGLDPAKKGNAAALAQVKARIETQIDAEQKANAQHPNRELSKDRRDEITRYWFGDVLTKKRYSWTGGLGDGTTTKKRWEVENVQDIVAAIPPSHMGGIVAYLEESSRRAGRKQTITLADLTPEEIAELDAQLFPKGKE